MGLNEKLCSLLKRGRRGFKCLRRCDNQNQVLLDNCKASCVTSTRREPPCYMYVPWTNTNVSQGSVIVCLRPAAAVDERNNLERTRWNWGHSVHVRVLHATVERNISLAVRKSYLKSWKLKIGERINEMHLCLWQKDMCVWVWGNTKSLFSQNTEYHILTFPAFI